MQQPPSTCTARHSSLLQLQLNQDTISSTDGCVLVKQLCKSIKLSDATAITSTSTSTPLPPGALLLDFSTSLTAATAITLGEVCGSAFLACARIKLCWQAPYHSSSIAGLPGHMQFLLVQLAQDGPYAVILPLLPAQSKATLQPASTQSPSGNMLAVHLDTGNPDNQRDSWHQALYIAAGRDPYALVEVSVTAAAAIAGGAKARWEKQVPDIAHYLGWCTWDAFYHDVSARGIGQGLESFRAAGGAVQPRWIIIDDGWQRTGLDNQASKWQQQQQQLVAPQQQQQQQQQHVAEVPSPQAPGTLRSHPLPDSALTDSSSSGGRGSSNSSSSGVMTWLARKVSRVLHKCVHALLLGVSAIADRLNWWSALLAGLRSPLLSGVLVRLLKSYNVATSEHSKRLLSNEFNAKFSNLSAGPGPDTSSTAAAAEVAGVIAAIKQRYGLKHVYAWHAILGYWSGVSPAAVAAPAAAAAASAAAASAAAAAGREVEAAEVAAAAAAGGKQELDVASEVASATAAAAKVAATAIGDEAAAMLPAGIAAAAVADVGHEFAVTGTGSSSSMLSTVVQPRVTPAMSDLEPPCNWSQLVLAGVGLPANPTTFYSQLHSYLAAIGITGVKVDVQNQLELVGSSAAAAAAAAALGAGGRPAAATAVAAVAGQPGPQALAAAWHAALEASAAAHFPGNQLINCMCHNTNNLYRMRDTAIARVSDDFYPRLPASHTTHVAVCAFNSLFMGVVVLPDWDMFHSQHPRALLHATARMISGGPVYVSDKPGRHDPHLLARLALPGGRLLQPQLPGRPTRDCLFKDPCRDGVSLLKVWSLNSCGGVLAAFNLQGSGWSRERLKFVTHDASPPTLATHVAPADIEGITSCWTDGSSGSSSSSAGFQDAAAAGGASAAGAGLFQSGSYVLYRDSSQSLCVVEGLEAGLSVELPPAGSDVITVAPLLQVRRLDSSHGSSSDSSNGNCGIMFAAVGLTNMLNPGGAVTGIAVTDAAVTKAGSSGAAGKECRHSGNSSSNSSSSGSWVVTGEEDVAGAAGSGGEASAVATVGSAKEWTGAAAGNSGSGAVTAAADDSGFSAGVAVRVLGCGQLLLYCSPTPSRVLLAGEVVSFKVGSSTDSSTDSSSIFVDIPAGDLADLDHDLSHEVVLLFKHDPVIMQ